MVFRFHFILTVLVLGSLIISVQYCDAQTPTLADTLRGSITPHRAWWNVLRYDLSFAPDYAERSLEGLQRITFAAIDTGRVMQVDLQAPMQMEAASLKEVDLKLTQKGDVWYLNFAEAFNIGDTATVLISYSGKPRVARNPPWDGGWIWAKDEKGRPWMTVACQGLGASVWYPCKDHQSDEPDMGASISITVPDSLVAVANGRLLAYEQVDEGLHGFGWEVSNPINTYNLVPYIGKYAHWSDSYQGLKGTLDLDFWVLDYELEKAKNHFSQVGRMLHCFEDWFGPYPFYEDGYKIVQAPHLGMEHQSAIAYGNHFGQGYRGTDLSGTGWGLKWDFIIIHESGHEWFGNSITTKDIADMWVHEAFTAYSESLFAECNDGITAGQDYVIGTRKAISNAKPIIGTYGINRGGSGDMYYKGANMLHTMRHIINNDSIFKAMLRAMNDRYYHSTVRSNQIEEFIIDFTGIDFSSFFDQYLRSTMIPTFQYRMDEQTANAFQYRWTNVVEGLKMLVRLDNGLELYPQKEWQSHPIDGSWPERLPRPDRNFYVDYQILE